MEALSTAEHAPNKRDSVNSFGTRAGITPSKHTMADFELLQATMSLARLGVGGGGRSAVPQPSFLTPYNNRSPWNSPRTDTSGGRQLFPRDNEDEEIRGFEDVDAAHESLHKVKRNLSGEYGF